MDAATDHQARDACGDTTRSSQLERRLLILSALVLLGAVAWWVGQQVRSAIDTGPYAGISTTEILSRLPAADKASWDAYVTALGQRGPAALDDLLAGLTHGHRNVREGAAHAIGDIGEPAARAVPALMISLEDEDDYVRWKSMRALARIGKAAEPARRQIEAAVNSRHETPVIKAWAETALRALDDEAR